MIPVALIAAALFSAPVTDTELAWSVADRSAPAAGLGAMPRLAGPPALPLQEQIDAWWADDGAALIAASLRPAPTLPSGFVLPEMLVGAPAVRLAANVSAFAAP